MESRSDPELARLVGQVLRVDRVLEECLHARHQDTRLPMPPGSQRRDPRRGLVGHELAPFVREGSPRFQDGDCRRIADPGLQLLGDPVADLRVAGDPDDAFADRQRGCRGTTSHRAGRRRRSRDGRPARDRPASRAAPGAWRTSRSRRGGAGAPRGPGVGVPIVGARPLDGTSVSISPPAASRRDAQLRPRRPPRRRRNRLPRRPGRVHGARRSRQRPSRRSAGPVRVDRGGAVSSTQASDPRSRPREDATPTRPRPADALLVRRAVDLAGRRQAGQVGLAELERVEAVGRLAGAVTGPRLDCVGRRVEQLVEPLRLVRLEPRQHVVAGVPRRIADADTKTAELLGPELVDDRAQPVMAAVAARLAEPELPERKREVVGDDQHVGQRRMLPSEDLADSDAGVVHPGQGLHEGQVQAVVPALRDVGGIALPAAPGPAGPLRDAVQHEPADVVARPGILRTWIAETDDDLQPLLHERRTARCGPNPVRRGDANRPELGGRAECRWYPARRARADQVGGRLASRGGKRPAPTRG